MHRSGQLIVEEVREARHAEPRVVEPIEIFCLAFEVMQPLDCQHRADRFHARTGTLGEQSVEPGCGPNLLQPALRGGGGAVELLAVPQRPLEQRAPRPHRLQLADRQKGDVVGGLGAVAVIVEAVRRLGHRREELQRDISVIETRQVDVAARGTVQRISLPQQGVGMEIDDGQRGMEDFRFLANLNQRLAVDLILTALDPARQDCRCDCDQQDCRNYGPA